MSLRCRSPRQAGGTVAVISLCVSSLVAPILVLGPPAAGATTGGGDASVGALHSVPCKAIKGQPAVEAPTWAQSTGAGATTGGWWCQLPHSTKIPSNFVTASRLVEPLANTYADFATEYVPSSTAGALTHEAGTSGPSITLSTRVDSAVTPPTKVVHGRDVKGTAVQLGTGVQGTMLRTKHLIAVTWRYPTTGVPKYLKGVATVTVTGEGVPEQTVLAVARSVRPN